MSEAVTHPVVEPLRSTLHRRLTRPWRAGAAFAVAAVLSACGGGGGSGPDGGDGTPQPPAPPAASCVPGVSPTFSGDLDWTAAEGVVGLGADGRYGIGIGVGISLSPVRGASVTVRQGDGSVIGSSTTGADGRATLRVCERTGPFVIEVAGRAGATYFDESRGGAGEEVPFGEGQLLRALVPGITGNIGVTPFTEAAAVQLDAAVSPSAMTAGPSGKNLPPPAAEAIRQANERIRSLLARLLPEGFTIDDITRMPALGGSGLPEGAPLPDSAAARHALALAAFGRQAARFNPSLSAPALAAGRQFAADAADGRIDGFGPGARPVAPVGERAYDPADLASALGAAVAVVARRHAEEALQGRLPPVVALGAVGWPGNPAAPVPTAVRLRRDGSVHVLDASGAETALLATEVAALFSASQQPPTVLFLKGTDGAFRALGHGGSVGLLGTGNSPSSTTPVAVPALAGVAAVSIGTAHALARRPDGTVLGWGSTARGQLAGASATATPGPIPGVTGAIAVLAIADLSFALRADGSLQAWGGGAAALGLGTSAPTVSTVPAPVLTSAGSPMDRVVAVVGHLGPNAGAEATLAALRADGTVWTWGDNTNGGLGRPGASVGVATELPGVRRIVALVSSGAGFVALDEDGSVFVWGATLPSDGTAPRVLAPVRVEGLPPIRELRAGFPGLYQVRLIGPDGQRWRIDGERVQQLTDERSELDLQPPSAGVTTIATVAGDNLINAAERAAGIVITGTVSQPNRPVTVSAGGVSRTVTAAGTGWSVPFAAAELPSSGVLEVSADFLTAEGERSATARRSVPIDIAPPALAITDDTPGSAGGPVTFTFTWNEPVSGFVAADVVASAGTRGVLTQVSSSVYRMVITPPPNTSGTLTVSVAAGTVTDLAGNPSASAFSTTQNYATDSIAPTATVTDDAPGVATGTVTFRFDWSEPVVGFDDADIVVSGGIRGAFTALAPNIYTVQVVPPAGQIGTITLSIQAGRVTDRAGNPNAAISVSQAFDTASYSGELGGASPGVGGDADGSAGDAGTPGNPPPPFPVTGSVQGSSLRLAWGPHAPEASVDYYQVLVRSQPSSRLAPLGARIPANFPAYAVSVARSPGTRTYRIRACNVPDPNDFGGLQTDNGFWGCTDSAEIGLDGQPVPPGFFVVPQLVTVSTDAGNALTGAAFTVTFVWNRAVTDFTQDDVEVVGGTKGAFSGSGTTYTLRVTPELGATTVIVRVIADAVPGVDGESNDEFTHFVP